MAETKLTDELRDKLADALGRLPVKHACALVGISDVTYYRWVERAETGEEPYASFVVLARMKRAEYIESRVRVIHDASNDDWKAAAWYLERCDPENFRLQTSSKSDVDVTSNGKPLESSPPPPAVYAAEVLAILDRHRANPLQDLGDSPPALTVESTPADAQADGVPRP